MVCPSRNAVQLSQAARGGSEYSNIRPALFTQLFVSDDKIATVGTVNMDYRSFIFHFECGAWICDNSTVLDIKDQFSEILKVSEEIKIDKWKKRPLKMRFKQALLHIFAPFM